MFTHILIPIDDDTGSRYVVELGVALAKKVGVRVTGFHAMTEFGRRGVIDELLAPPPEELRALAQVYANKLFAPLLRETGLAGIACDIVARRPERPHEAIVETARESRCDLVIMASQGHRGLAKLLPGSQTQQVLNHAGAAVLVLR